MNGFTMVSRLSLCLLALTTVIAADDQITGKDCRDGLACFAMYDPVCGTDGKTYGNKCEMKRQNCNTDVDVSVLHQGHCKGGKKTERAAKECSTELLCPAQYDPVCGTDGKTYANECDMRRHNCKAEVQVSVLQHGRCKEPNLPTDAKRFRRVPICSRLCHGDEKPVQICGSDNKTYDDLCDFMISNCQSGKYVRVKHIGACKDLSLV